MFSQRKSRFILKTKSILASALIAGFMTVAVAPRLRADNDFSKCREKTEKIELKWEKAIADHGRDSEEAREHANDLRNQRQQCYEKIHQWWDAKRQKWQKNDHFDKDLHDHDHDDDGGSK